MESKDHIQTRIGLFIIIGLLIAVTYLLFKTSTALTSQTVRTSSQAEELDVEPADEMADYIPDFIPTPDCTNYQEWITRMRSKLREAAKLVKVRTKLPGGDTLVQSCADFIYEPLPITPGQTDGTDPNLLPIEPVQYPKKCKPFMDMEQYIREIGYTLQSTCAACFKSPTPTPKPTFSVSVPSQDGNLPR